MKKLFSFLIIGILIVSGLCIGLNNVNSSGINTNDHFLWNVLKNEDQISIHEDRNISFSTTADIGVFFITRDTIINTLPDEIKNRLDQNDSQVNSTDIFNNVAKALYDEGVWSRLKYANGVPYLECGATFVDTKTISIKDYDLVGGTIDNNNKLHHYDLNVEVKANPVETIVTFERSNYRVTGSHVFNVNLEQINYRYGEDIIPSKMYTGDGASICIKSPYGVVSKTKIHFEDGVGYYSLDKNPDAANGVGGIYEISIDLPHHSLINNTNTVNQTYTIYVKGADHGAVWEDTSFQAPNHVEINNKRGGILSFNVHWQMQYFDKYGNFLSHTKTYNLDGKYGGNTGIRMDIPFEAAYMKYTVDVANDGKKEFTSDMIPVGNGLIYFEGPVYTENTHIKSMYGDSVYQTAFEKSIKY